MDEGDASAVLFFWQDLGLIGPRGGGREIAIKRERQGSDSGCQSRGSLLIPDWETDNRHSL